MDQKAIETLAVNAIRDRIVMSDYLDQSIADNDKEPSFDGFVYLYSQKGKKKENQIGRIPVQVKGTQRKLAEQQSGILMYPVGIADLRNYLSEGGAVYFVVHISRDGQVRRIFYNDLLPIKIMKELAQKQNHKTVNLKFKIFPTEPDRIRALFVLFDDHRKKQAILNDLKEIPSVDELQKKGNLREINLTVAGSGAYKNHVDAFLNEDIYVYAKLNETEANFPVDLITETQERVISQEIDKPVSVGDIPFYDKYSVLNYVDKAIVRVGESFSFTFPRASSEMHNQKIKANYTANPLLRIKANDLAFLLAFVEAQGFQLNGSFVPFPLELNLSAESIQNARDELIR